jgi:hypothetical protein
MSGWIGVDLDGTLARYDGMWQGPTHIGAPIPAMVERVKQWLEQGREVRIFTARVTQDKTRNAADTELISQHIRLWCQQHLGAVLQITNVKDFGMVELWDDRAVRVQANTGQPCCMFWSHHV